jgi:hypothetical protein
VNYLEMRNRLSKLHSEYVRQRQAIIDEYQSIDKAQAKRDRANNARAHQSAREYLAVWDQFLPTIGASIGGEYLGAADPGIALACKLDARFEYDAERHKVTRIA